MARLYYRVGKTHLFVTCIRTRIKNAKEFMKDIRKVPHITVQAVDANFVYDMEHLLGIVEQSLEAKKTGTMLSKRMEIDLLLRLAGTNQIDRAVNDIGIKDDADVLVIAMGSVSDLKVLQRRLGNHKLYTLKPSAKKRRMLCMHHKISMEEMRSCMGEDKVAAILAERANLLW